ncbi:MAG: hypothetical protein QOI36_2348 [Pseudonocardiales bacterium]|nr:hypothetical protein [Pseudonocardia sp.]MDT7650942.1 hypothetical protein [Pseudonocardiales bacterium]
MPASATAPSRRFRTLALPLGMLTVAFLAFALPPYLGLDPARTRLPMPEDAPWFYPALVAHIGFGSIALLTASLQVWPWLRRTHPTVHRWSGRAYLALGVLPGAVAVLAVAPFGVSGGLTGRVANTMLAVLWLGTALAGYRAARARRFAEHREWMVRSVALTFSIVANRAWSMLCIAVFAPEVMSGGPFDEAALAQAVGVSMWLSWVVNLLVAEYWLHRTRHRRPARPALRDADRRPVPVTS